VAAFRGAIGPEQRRRARGPLHGPILAELARVRWRRGWLCLVSHSRFIVSERFKSGFGAALVQPFPVLNRGRPEFTVGDGELGAVQLRLVGINPHPVLQVGQVGPRRLPLGGCAAQGMQEGSLLDGIMVSVLG
jgi:hypothetical protein